MRCGGGRHTLPNLRSHGRRRRRRRLGTSSHKGFPYTCERETHTHRKIRKSHTEILLEVPGKGKRF